MKGQLNFFAGLKSSLDHFVSLYEVSDEDFKTPDEMAAAAVLNTISMASDFLKSLHNRKSNVKLKNNINAKSKKCTPIEIQVVKDDPEPAPVRKIRCLSLGRLDMKEFATLSRLAQA